MEVGLIGEARVTVDNNNTAIAHGSGSLPVFATPALIALLEKAAVAAVAGALGPGSTTVGTKIDVAHLAATSVGGSITAFAKLVGIDGRRLVFSVSAEDQSGAVGQGTHERYVVEEVRFMEKAAARLRRQKP